MVRSISVHVVATACAVVAPASAAWAQDHAHMQMTSSGSGWQLSQDATLFGLFNRQGGPRGGREFVVPNWWMGMASRSAGKGRLTFDVMLSLDPATVGTDGYREIFQVGEALRGAPLVDRQHPHDFFMQVSATWRVPLSGSTGFTLSGGPAGEPALGPTAFMHRASAADLPMAPLSHHTFDSTHVSFGVITAAVDRGPWAVEASVFNGREPDEHRWDFDFGRLDSVSGRVWFRPGNAWEFQVSSGHLRQPEQLEPGNIQRTTASGSWLHQAPHARSAVTVGYGINATSEGRRQAVFGEFVVERGATSVFGRLEDVQVETALLQAGQVAVPATRGDRSLVGEVTAGLGRTLFTSSRADGLLGAEVSLYAVPDSLKSTHGDHPASFQIFFRMRLRQNEKDPSR